VNYVSRVIIEQGPIDLAFRDFYNASLPATKHNECILCAVDDRIVTVAISTIAIVDRMFATNGAKK
jgi:hypothetical protein